MNYGHYYTQYKLLHIDENQISLFSNTNQESVICYRKMACEDALINKETIQKIKTDERTFSMEWQANYFSASILVPDKTLKMYIKELGYDYTNITIEERNRIIPKLASKFNVSKEMIKYKLDEFNGGEMQLEI